MWSSLIGKKIVAYRGHIPDAGKFGVDPTKIYIDFILFDDNETYLQLEEQDPYDYHDCARSARILNIRKDAELWKRLFEQTGFKESTETGHYPW